MKSDIDNFIDTLFTGQLFIDSIENLSNKFYFKHRLKQTGKQFIKEMEQISKTIYNNVREESDKEYLTHIYDINYQLMSKLNGLDIFEKQTLLENFEQLTENVKQQNKQ